MHNIVTYSSLVAFEFASNMKFEINIFKVDSITIQTQLALLALSFDLLMISRWALPAALESLRKSGVFSPIAASPKVPALGVFFGVAIP